MQHTIAAYNSGTITDDTYYFNHEDINSYYRNVGGTALDKTEIQNKIQEGLNATYAATPTITGTTTVTMTSTDSLGELGVSENTYITIWNDGTNVLVTITPDDTVQGMLDKLSPYGITGSVSDGKLTLNGDNTHYIKSISSSLTNVLKIQAGEGYTYNTTIEYITSGTSATSTVGVTASVVTTITGDTSINVDISLNDMMDMMEAQAARVESGSLPVAVTRMTQTEATNAGYTWVTNADQLQQAILNNENICLGNDIDMSGVTNWEVSNYSGEVFDGNGYTIKNFTLTSDNAFQTGLISYANNTTFRNIRMENIYITATNSFVDVGGLVGNAGSSTFENIAVVSGTIKATNTAGNIGGIAGTTDLYDKCTISNVYNGVDIIADSSDGTGGIIGYGAFDLTNAYNKGHITRGNYTGGIAGYIYVNSSITNAYNASSVDLAKYNGGIAGFTREDVTITNVYSGGSIGSYSATAEFIGGIVAANSATINNAYFNGAIYEYSKVSTPYVGGIVGRNYREATLNYAFVDGTVTISKGNYCGGLVGYNQGTIEHSVDNGKVGACTYYIAAYNCSIQFRNYNR